MPYSTGFRAGAEAASTGNPFSAVLRRVDEARARKLADEKDLKELNQLFIELGKKHEYDTELEKQRGNQERLTDLFKKVSSGEVSVPDEQAEQLLSQFGMSAKSKEQEVNPFQPKLPSKLSVNAGIESKESKIPDAFSLVKNVKGMYYKINEIIDYLNGNGTAGGGSYKSYVALLTQSGVTAPTATILQNTLTNVVLQYDGVGSYIISFDDYVQDKVTVLIGNNMGSDSINKAYINEYSPFGVYIDTYDSETTNFCSGVFLSNFIFVVATLPSPPSVKLVRVNPQFLN